MPLLIAALLCTAFCAGADSQSALDAWPTLKFGYSVPGKAVTTPSAGQPKCANTVDALSLLKSQGDHISSEIAINEELFFNGASCGTCVIYRDLSKNERIQWPWSVGIVTQSCAECKGDISLGILRAKESRAIEWMPVLCITTNSTLFYAIRQNASSPDAALTIVNSRLPIVKVESLANNGSWVPLTHDGSRLGTFTGYRRSELSLKVRVTSIYGTSIEDLIPGDSGGFGHAQFLPAAPVYQLPASSQPLHSSRNLLQVLKEQALTPEEQSRQKYSIVPVRAPAPAPAASLYNSSRMQDYEQCGGITNCPFQGAGGPCADTQYFACAIPASACVRINAYYWQCRAKPASARAPSAGLASASAPLASTTLAAEQSTAASPASALAPMATLLTAEHPAAASPASAPASVATPPAQQAAAVGPAPAPAPGQERPITEDGLHPPRCTPGSTDAKCLFGRTLLDLPQALSPSRAPLPSEPLPVVEGGVTVQPPKCKALSTDPKCAFGRRLADTTAAAAELAGSGPAQPSDIIMQAVRRHLAAAAVGAPVPSANPAAAAPAPAPGPSPAHRLVPDYGTCGGTGSGCPLPRALCKDEAYLPCGQGSKCVRLSQYYWQCQHAVTAGARDPISAGVPSQAPSAAAAKRSSQSSSPSPVPPASVESLLVATHSSEQPFVADPTLMIQPKMQSGSAEADDYVRDFGRCGGTAGFCPTGQNCTDAADLDCYPGSECVRFSAMYWQCRPKAASGISGLAGRRLQQTTQLPEPPTPSKFGPLPGPKIVIEPKPVPWGSSANSTNVPDFSQCGGIGETCPLVNQKACTDAQYMDCAYESSRCVRLSKFFWQCRPHGAPSLTNNSGGPAQDYTQCGGVGETCPLPNKTRCKDSPYLKCQLQDSKCTRVNKWYWHCLPQNSPAPAPGPGRPTAREFALAAQIGAPAAAPLNQPQAATHAIRAPKEALARKGRGSFVSDFSQCGGSGDACPLTNGELCVDGQYLDCPPESHCVRQTEWYWQCLPAKGPAPAPQKSVGRRLQAAATAPSPSSIGPLPAPKPAPKIVLPGGKALSYDQCGGHGDTCPLTNRTLCTDAQYLDCSPDSHCVRQTEWYWQCLPAKAPAPQKSVGRRLQAAATAPIPSSTGPLPAPKPAPKIVLAGGKALSYEQCGGQGESCPLTNRTLCADAQYLKCATPGFHCMRQSNWYWQCVPALAGGAAAPQPSLAAQPPAQKTLQPGSTVPIFFQCGGMGQSCPLADKTKCTDAQYLSCASDNLQCVRQSQWYWQCVPKTAPAPALTPKEAAAVPAPYGRRLHAEAPVAEAPAASKHAPLPGPQPGRNQAAAGGFVPDFFQCGGRGDACPLSNTQLCTDAQYLNCAPGISHCVRQSKWYWQCLPSSGPAPAPAPRSTSGRRLLQASEAPTPSRLGPLPEPYTGGKRQTNPAGRNHTKVPDYGQCGGTETCPLVSSFCTDSQYLPCAIKTSQCIRMSATFWECLPNSYNGLPLTPPDVPLQIVAPFPDQVPPPPASGGGGGSGSAQGGRRLTEATQEQDPIIAKEGEVCGGWGPWCQSQYGPTACASNKQVAPCEENTTCILISGDIMQCIRTHT